MELSISTVAQKAPHSAFSTRIDSAIFAAKSATKRQISAVPESTLDEMYRRSVPPRTLLPAKTTVKLAVDEATGTVIGRVIDKENGDLIAQLPSEEILRLIAQTKEMLQPLVNETV